MSMTYMTFDHIATTIKRMPIRALRMIALIANGFTADVTLDFFTVESESTYTLEPITKPTSNGGVVTVAYRWSAKIYIPHNLYDRNQIISVLDVFQSKRVYDAQLFLGNKTISGVTPPDIINADDGMYLNLSNKTFLYQIESVEFRPRLIITFSGVTKGISGIFQ